jgi:hypothetical protein
LIIGVIFDFYVKTVKILDLGIKYIINYGSFAKYKLFPPPLGEG